MTKKVLALIAGMALTATMAQADGGQTVTVGGQTVSKTVAQITFSGDNVLLHFTDGSTQTVDMEQVTITFSDVDALKALNAATPQDAAIEYFDMNGHQLKQAPRRGAYIMRKGNKVVKLIKN